MKSIKRRISILLALVMVIAGVCVFFMDGKEAKAAEVDTGMLAVKMQISNASVTDGNVTAHRAIRFISSIDSLDYREVGFVVNGNYYSIRTVYEQIDSTLYEGSEKLEYTFSPKIVDTDSKYFFTAKMAVSEEKLNNDFTVQAYCRTPDGEIVLGEERVVSVAKDTAANTINMTVNGELDKENSYTAAFTSKVNSTVTSVTETAANVEVLSVGEGYSNVRITLTGTNKVADMASATAISINGTDATGIFRNYHTSYLSGTNAGKADTSWYDVNATATEFVIATNADLYGFATILDNFAGDSVYLVSDIKANEGTASASSFTGTTQYEWNPIGATYTDQNEIYRNFAGTFDGQGHTISGVYVTRTGTANGSWGLFGEANASTIKNFTLANSYFGFSSITNTFNAGAIAGKSIGILDTVKVEDTVYINSYGSQEEHTGGIVGYMSGTAENYGKITNCWFDGTITGHDYIGGIVSFVQDGTSTTASTLHKKEVEISNCLNSGTIILNKKQPILGGICSYINMGQAIIEDCVNVSSIELNGFELNTTLTGSVVGWVTVNPYNDDTTAVSTNKRYSAVINNTYGTSDGNWKCTLFSNGKGSHCIDGAETLGSKTQRLSTFKNLAYYQGETGYMNMNLDFAVGNAYAGYWTVTTSTPVLSSFVSDEAVFDVQNVSTPRTVWYLTNVNEYQLCSKADMYGFASLTDNDFAGKTVKLGADIALNEGTASKTGFAAKSGTTLVQWTPKTLAGTFDGQGHAISGLYINTTKGNAGLFATVTGTVKDVKLLNSYISCTDNTANNYESKNYLYATGSIAGSLNGTIDTVYSDAIVYHKYAYAGGIVGTVYGTGTNVITNSCFAGYISGRNAIGGIVGLVVNTSANVTHCLNAGTVGTTNMITSGLVSYVWINDSDATHTFKMVDCLNVGRRDITSEGMVTEEYASGACAGYLRGTTTANTSMDHTYYIRWYTDKNDTWARANWGANLTYVDATGANQNTYHAMTEAAVYEHNFDLSFLPEGQTSSSTDDYYWLAKPGQIPMLENFEDLLTDITF